MRYYHFHRTASTLLMLSLLILVLWAGCFVVDPYNVCNKDYSASESFSYKVDVVGQTVFTISGINGPIDIVGDVEATTVDVWGEKIVESESLEDAEAHLDGLEVQVTSNESDVSVRTIQPSNTHGRNYKVVYHVRVPETLRVYVENTNGNAEVASISNDVSIEIINGNAILSDISCFVNVDLTNGNIGLTNIIGSVDGEVTNGNLEGTVFLPLQGVCRLKSTNGNIQVMGF